MSGYIARRRGRFYVVIYDGTDPATGKERRSWHPAGTDRDAAERLAKKLAADKRRRDNQIEALYENLLHPAGGQGLAPETVYEIHLRIRGALDDAVRRGS